MPKQYTREELWKLYEKLPEELKEVIFSEETATRIGNTCERYEIPEETISKVAKQVGNVLLGLLPPEEFQNILTKEIKLKKDIADKVTQEINRFIFYPAEAALEALYKIGVETPAEEKEKIKPELKEPLPAASETKEAEVKPAETTKKDVYREPVE